MKNRQPSLMVHTNPEFETSNLILDFEFDQHLESHKHVINIIMWFRDMGCYKNSENFENQSHSKLHKLSDKWLSSRFQDGIRKLGLFEVNIFFWI
jgi:hypothetical protein